MANPSPTRSHLHWLLLVAFLLLFSLLLTVSCVRTTTIESGPGKLPTGRKSIPNQID